MSGVIFVRNEDKSAAAGVLITVSPLQAVHSAHCAARLITAMVVRAAWLNLQASVSTFVSMNTAKEFDCSSSRMFLRSGTLAAEMLREV